jgi:succinoglycan biosynthesis transport protein ExoP
MTFRHYLLILKARYKVTLLIIALSVSGALLVTKYGPAQYTAEASVLVDVRAPDTLSALVMPNTLTTQADIIASDRVAQHVVQLLKLDNDPRLKQKWLKATFGTGNFKAWIADGLQKNLKVTPLPDRNVITIAFRGPDPRYVASVANAFAQAYVEEVIEMKVEPAKQYAVWFSDQAKTLRENVEKAQLRLSRFQQSKGIVDREEKLDFETAKLRELSAQLTVVQGQTYDSQSKQKSGADTLPEIMGNAVITGLKADIARKQAALDDAAVNLGKNHPQYIRMESELASLRHRLSVETQQIAQSYSTTSTVNQDREAELVTAIEAQKRKLLALRHQRDELEVLQRDVDSAVKAYEAISTRLSQTNLESQATRTNVSLLSPAVEPLEPSFPKPLEKMLIISLVIGIVLGTGAAFAFEQMDQRIRSIEDLAAMLPVPVLGVIPRTKPPGKLHLLLSSKPRLRGNR